MPHRPCLPCLLCTLCPLQNRERARRGEPPSRPLVLTSKSRAGALAVSRPGLSALIGPGRVVWLDVRCSRCPSIPAALLSLASWPHICPADVLLSLTAAHVTGTGPHVAGIILTDSKESVG